MTVQEFEDRVWELETIRLVIRAPTGYQVQDYEGQNKTTASWNVTKWLTDKVMPKIGQLQAIVVAGDGEEPHGRTILRTLRHSYDGK